jgi:hypothetical protein
MGRFRTLAAAALAAGLGACGGSPAAAPTPPPPTTTTTLPPATLADLTAAVTSPEQYKQVNCRDDVHARVTLSNNAASSVVVTGVQMSSNSLSGGCISAADYTYRLRPLIVAGRSASVVMDRSLYDGGAGCCSNPKKCGGKCDIEKVFQVVTEIGSVPAGQVVYTLSFDGCQACGSTSSVTGACPPAFQEAAAASISSRYRASTTSQR